LIKGQAKEQIIFKMDPLNDDLNVAIDNTDVASIMASWSIPFEVESIDDF
jgi:hypothetical protein